MWYVISISILFIIVAWFIIKPSEKVATGIYYVAKAGEVEKASPLKMAVSDLNSRSYVFDGKSVDIRDYEVFLVDGDSMSPVGIKNGSGLLVRRVFQKMNVTAPAILIFEINLERYMAEHENHTCEPGYKVRQFLGYISLNQSDEAIRNTVMQWDEDLSNDEMWAILQKKLSSAVAYYGKEATLILSQTYTEGKKSYSFHSPQDLYGVVQYVIPPSEIKVS